MAEPAYGGDDFYCHVAIPRKVDLVVVHDCDQVLAFHHTRPSWPTHIVVVPKRHIGSLTTVTLDDHSEIQALLRVVQQVARDAEKRDGAARVITNVGRYQDSKHLHVHIVSGAQAP